MNLYGLSDLLKIFNKEEHQAIGNCALIKTNGT